MLKFQNFLRIFLEFTQNAHYSISLRSCFGRGLTQPVQPNGCCGRSTGMSMGYRSHNVAFPILTWVYDQVACLKKLHNFCMNVRVRGMVETKPKPCTCHIKLGSILSVSFRPKAGSATATRDGCFPQIIHDFFEVVSIPQLMTRAKSRFTVCRTLSGKANHLMHITS